LARELDEAERAAKQFIEDGLSVFALDDREQWLPRFHPEVEFHFDLGFDSGTYHGRDQLFRALRQWYGAWESLELEVEDVQKRDGVFLVPVRYTGRGRGSGAEVVTRFWWVVEWQDGVVRHWHVCADEMAALDLVGARGAVDRAR
jgi:hypothetical protein